MRVKNFGGTPLVLAALALLNYARILTFKDVYWDDNLWLLAFHTTENLQDFLATGFTQLRREPLGVFLHALFSLHQIGDSAFFIWHSLSLVLQVATPIVLYCLVRNVCNGRSDIAAFVAVASIVLPLDQTLPFVSATNYRLALVLSLISLYLTERATRNEHIDRGQLVAALAITAVAAYVLMEATIAMEPARLLIVGRNRHLAKQTRADANKQTVLTCAAFLALVAPLVIYKLVAKPHGVYDWIYPTSLGNLFDWSALRETLHLFLFGNWRLLQQFHGVGSWITPVLGLLAGFILFVASKHVLRQEPITRPSTTASGAKFLLSTPTAAFVLATAILIPQLVLFGYAALLPKVGGGTSHAIFMQPGYALLIGAALWLLVRRCLTQLTDKPALLRTLLAVLAAAGTYFNNLNLDVYAAASKREDAFWAAFIGRFPVLPETANFMIDATPIPYARGVPTFFRAEDLFNPYEFEFRLLTYYSSGHRAEKTRRYRVIPGKSIARDVRDHGTAILRYRIETTTHFGVQTIDPADLIVVHYRNNELLINREIVERYPKIEYAPWADKPTPNPEKWRQ